MTEIPEAVVEKALRSALRFAASRSAITAAEESAILDEFARHRLAAEARQHGDGGREAVAAAAKALRSRLRDEEAIICVGYRTAVEPFVQRLLAAVEASPALPDTTGREITDAQVRAHHRYRTLHEDFVTVETDLRNVALLVGHHYNSCRPVAPVVEEALSRQRVDDRMRAALALAANRLARCAVEQIADGKANQYEWAEWANEARAALEGADHG